MRRSDLPFGMRAHAAGLIALSLSPACSAPPAPPTTFVAPAEAPALSTSPATSTTPAPSSAPTPGDVPPAPAPPPASDLGPSPATGPCAGKVLSAARSPVGDIGIRLVESTSAKAQVLCLRKGQTHTMLLRLGNPDLQEQEEIMSAISPILALPPGKALTPAQRRTLERSIWEVSDLGFSAKGDTAYFTSTLMGVGAPPQLTWRVDLPSEALGVFTGGSVRPVVAGAHAGKLLRVWSTYDSPRSPTYRPGVITKCEIVSEQGKALKALSDDDCSRALSDAPP